MEKLRNITTRQYEGLIRDIYSRMAQMPPLFNDNQQLDESEIVCSLENKAIRANKAMLILQCYKVSSSGIKTLQYQHGLVCSNRFVFK